MVRILLWLIHLTNGDKMDRELEDKIVRDHPLLFADRYKKPSQSCMSFGLAVGNGWYDLLYEACSKIEPLIKKFIKEHQITKCYTCGCDVTEHKSGLGCSECQAIHFLPYHFGKQGCYCITFCWHNIKQNIKSWQGIKYLWKHMVLANIKRRWYSVVNRISYKLFEKFNVGYHKSCFCKNFELVHPRASQVKEKFGELCFYMSGATAEIYKITHEAERKSAITCENCGQPGKLREEGWLFTLCDECNTIKQKTGRAPWLSN